MVLKQNVGPLDRATRLILGAILVAVASFFKVLGLLGAVIFWFGVLTFIEGVMGYCLLYGLFSWSTKHRRGQIR